MKTERLHRYRHALLGWCVAALALLPANSAWADGSGPDVRIGWTAWSDAEFVSKFTALVLREMGVDVELTLADVSAQYRGLADGDLDLMLMSWQPNTHADYIERYGEQLDDLGTLYEGADLGLAVPQYVDSSITEIGDLREHGAVFERTIEGIDQAAGVMRITEQAIETYELDDFTLTSTSGPAMAQRLGRAVADERPIVVTAWRPHWKWAEYDLRYLEDPEGLYDSVESIHAMARDGFAEDNPRVARFIEAMQFELDELQALMARAREEGHRTTIRNWLNDNRERVERWLQGG